MSIKISLDYKDYGVDVKKLTKEQKENLIKPKDIVMSFIRTAIHKNNPQGLPSDKLRIVNGITEKFEKAKDKDETIELNEYEVAFVKQNYKEAKFEVADAKIAVAIYDMIYGTGK
jgi:hypothetical protein